MKKTGGSDQHDVENSNFFTLQDSGDLFCEQDTGEDRWLATPFFGLILVEQKTRMMMIQDRVTHPRKRRAPTSNHVYCRMRRNPLNGTYTRRGGGGRQVSQVRMTRSPFFSQVHLKHLRKIRKTESVLLPGFNLDNPDPVIFKQKLAQVLALKLRTPRSERPP